MLIGALKTKLFHCRMAGHAKERPQRQHTFQGRILKAKM